MACGRNAGLIGHHTTSRPSRAIIFIEFFISLSEFLFHHAARKRHAALHTTTVPATWYRVNPPARKELHKEESCPVLRNNHVRARNVCMYRSSDFNVLYVRD